MAYVAPSTHSLSPTRILVVDDDPSMLLLCTKALTDAGYAVLAAAGSTEAMAVYASGTDPIDLLLIDLFLPPPDFQLSAAGAQYPRVNGHQLLYQALSLRKPLRALFISSHPYASLVSQGITIQPEQFLEKPFSVEALLNHVATALAAPAIRQDPAGETASHEEVPWVD